MEFLGGRGWVHREGGNPGDSWVFGLNYWVEIFLKCGGRIQVFGKGSST